MKKILTTLVAVLMFTAMTYGEEKFAYINAQAVLMDMPEVAEMQKTLEAEQTKYKGEMDLIQKEYEDKMMAYKEQEATMSDAMKQTRQSELADIEQRYQTFVQSVRQELQKKQEEIMAPIFEKLQNAIKDVGAEKGFTYILDESTQVILYHAPSAVDAEPLVRAKLGLAKKQ